jgi:hypothetical protein
MASSAQRRPRGSQGPLYKALEYATLVVQLRPEWWLGNIHLRCHAEQVGRSADPANPTRSRRRGDRIKLFLLQCMSPKMAPSGGSRQCSTMPAMEEKRTVGTPVCDTDLPSRSLFKRLTHWQ